MKQLSMRKFRWWNPNHHHSPMLNADSQHHAGEANLPSQHWIYLHSVLTSLVAIVFIVGCGSTRARNATEQLLTSHAIDRTVATINFTPLAQAKVFLDTTYLLGGKTIDPLYTNYIISSLRQQLVTAGCRLQEEMSESDYVLEARLGALGTDGHELLLGISESSSLSSAATLVPNAPMIPSIPELSFIKKESQSGAAKIALFAYHRESGTPVWQSGITKSMSTATDLWVFGAGPFQRGSIHNETLLAGDKLNLKTTVAGSKNKLDSQMVAFGTERSFVTPWSTPGPAVGAQVSYEAPVIEPTQIDEEDDDEKETEEE